VQVGFNLRYRVFFLFCFGVIVEHYVASNRRVTGDDKYDKTRLEAVAALSGYFLGMSDNKTGNIRIM
jgi:hypothetical protein